ncbi:MAG: transcription antitermination factor NusB [Candidatus Brocadiales bacterium]|nr:transcription antitermination factor NusB [Candidatus Bathyanammoxibius amoris]
MRKRTRARELALQALYQIDIRGQDVLDEAVSSCISRAEDDEVAGFAAELVKGCRDRISDIDKEVSSVVENWELPRMAVVDRCILRLAVYELLFRDDIPPKVSVNEAIDLAKKYSTENSGTFVNGILDKVYANHYAKSQKYGKMGPKVSLVADYGEADLHVHTICSDGTFSPEEVVEEAVRVGLKTMAITDHDTIDAVRPAQREGLKRNVHIIPGVEVSGYVQPYEIHILGLFIDIDNSNLTEKFVQIIEERVTRISAIVEKLSRVGVNIDKEEVFNLAGNSPPGRMHMAELLVKHGYCKNLAECFARYIGDDGPAYVPKKILTPRQAIELIDEAGGVSVYAHPGLSGKDDIIPLLVDSGLQAIEVYYPSHTPEIVEKYLGITKKYNLIPVGGSDFHGLRKPSVPLGKITVSNETVLALRERCKQPRDVLTAT